MFKAGDRVRRIGTSLEDVVTGVPGMYSYDNMDFRYSDHGMQLENNTWQFQKDWELITNKTLMHKVSNMMKKLLDADTQILVKAGYINGDLEITSEGAGALREILFSIHKTTLVEAAKAQIAEEEK